MNVLLCLIGILFFALIVNYFLGRATTLREGNQGGFWGGDPFENQAYMEKLDKEAEKDARRATREEKERTTKTPAPTTTKTPAPTTASLTSAGPPPLPGTAGYKPTAAPPVNNNAPPPAQSSNTPLPKRINDGTAAPAPPSNDGTAAPAPPSNDGTPPPPPSSNDGTPPPPPPSNDGTPPPPPPSNDGTPPSGDAIAVHYSNRTFMF